jgi:hypothetical protein
MKVEILDITPEMAKKWLNKNNIQNRPISFATVDKYATDMINGKWSLTHQGIGFYRSGNFADGQHRLMAIVKANCTIQMLVTFDIEDEASTDIDGVKPRTVVDQLNISGTTWIKNKHTSMIRLLINVKYNNFKSNLSAHEMLRIAVFLKKNLVYAANNFKTTKKGISSSIVLSAVAMAHLNGVDENRLADFCRILYSGVIDSTDDTSAIRLRDYLTSIQGNHDIAKQRKDVFLKVQRAIKAFCQNEQLGRIYIPASIIYEIPELLSKDQQIIIRHDKEKITDSFQKYKKHGSVLEKSLVME